MSGLLKIAAALPFAHITLCYWYIFCFTSGFGGRLYNLVSVADIFSVSVASLAKSYAVALATIIFVQVALFERPAALVTNEELKLKATFGSNLPEKMFYGALGLSALVLVVVILFLRVLYVPAAIGVFSIIVYYLNTKIQIEGKKESARFYVISVLLTLTIFNISVTAYSEGFHLRHDDQNDMSEDVLYCGNSPIYKSIGEYFISISKNEQRVLLDVECDVVFTVPKSEIVIDIK